MQKCRDKLITPVTGIPNCRCSRLYEGLTWIPWKLSFCYISFHEKIFQMMLWHLSQRQSQFTPKMKANAVPHLLSSLVWIDQCNECNVMTSFMEFMVYFLRYVYLMHPFPAVCVFDGLISRRSLIIETLWSQTMLINDKTLSSKDVLGCTNDAY